MRVPRALGVLVLSAALAGCVCCPREAPCAASPGRLDVEIAADGGVKAVAETARGGLTFFQGRLAAPDVEATDRTLRGLIELAADVAGSCGATSPAPPPVRVTVAPTAPWMHVLWVMQVLETPGVRLWRVRIRLGPDEPYVVADLPEEDVLETLFQLEAEAERTGDDTKLDAYLNPGALKVRLFRKQKHDPDAAFTRIRAGAWDAPTHDLPPASRAGGETRARIWATIEAIVRAGRAEDPDRIGEIQTRPPHGPAVPAGDVVRVLRMFRAAGYTEVRFEATVVPTT